MPDKMKDRNKHRYGGYEKLSTEDKEVANQAKLGKSIWDRDRGECTGKVLGLGGRVWYVKKHKGDQWYTASMGDNKRY